MTQEARIEQLKDLTAYYEAQIDDAPDGESRAYFEDALARSRVELEDADAEDNYLREHGDSGEYDARRTYPLG